MTLGDVKRLRNAFRGFDKRTLLDVAFPLFPQLSSKDIEKRVRQLQLATKESVLVKIFIELLETTDITKDEVDEQIPSLQVLGVALKAERRKWSAFSLIGEPNMNEHWTSQELELEVKRSLRRNNTEAIVKVLFLDKIYWINICAKHLKKNRLRIMAPLYCAVFVGEPYFFASRTSPPHKILQSVSEALGYPDYKNNTLCGHHLPSLIQQLLNKKLKPANIIPISLSESILETSTNADHTQYVNRRKFVDQLFGSNPPKLSNYVVEAKGVPCRGIRRLAEMKGELMDIKLKFKTKDTIGMLKVMAEEGILDVPPPGYVQSILNTGKSSIRIQPKQVHSQTDTETDASVRSTHRR